MNKIKDLTGFKIGSITVIKRCGSMQGRAAWEYQCVCGKVKIATSNNLIQGHIKNCGCFKKKRIHNLIGKKFGYLTVIKIMPSDKNGRARWLCKCICDKERIFTGNLLLTGGNKSCGCKRNELFSLATRTHWQSKHKGIPATTEFNIWMGMKQRCSNPKQTNYKNYGGRGIKVCDRWLHSFENFLADMGKRPSKKYTLDRINNNGNYEPSNCRWATYIEQSKNRRPMSINRWQKLRASQISLSLPI